MLPPPTSPAKDLPRLKRSVQVIVTPPNVILTRLADEVLLEGAAADLFEQLAPLLDGTRSYAALGQQLGQPEARVRQLLEELEAVGVVGSQRNEDQRLMSGLEFHALHRTYGQHWLQPVYAHPLWEKIVEGRASLAQVLGFGFEKYHYIEAAFEHMGIAAANATPEQMPHLARHFIEEYSHGDIYRKGLRSLFDDQVVLESQPLPSTRALVNYLSETAQRNSFAYYAGNEILQMTENAEGGAGEAVESFYAAMRRHYPQTGKLVDSFIAHTRADQQLGHADVFKDICGSAPPLTSAEVNDALNVARNMAEHLKLFMDGIDVFYDRFPTVPRLASQLLSE